MVSGIWMLIALGKQQDLRRGRQRDLTHAERDELKRLFAEAKKLETESVMDAFRPFPPWNGETEIPSPDQLADRK